MNDNSEFKPWFKTPRLDSPFVITEKIDGTNSAILIQELDLSILQAPYFGVIADYSSEDTEQTKPRYFGFAAQSRNRFISPGQDNYGFASWVGDHMSELFDILGPGRHFGEWWGGGLQRGYGLDKKDKRFSLFNIKRYNPLETVGDLAKAQYEDQVLFPDIPEVGIVPVLDWEDEDVELFIMSDAIDIALGDLIAGGSRAVKGYEKPEGIVLWHTRADQLFKKYVDPAQKTAEVNIKKGQ